MLSSEQRHEEPSSYPIIPNEILSAILEHSPNTFNIYKLRKFIHHSFKGIISLAAINKETSENRHGLYEEIVYDIVKKFGILLIDGIYPWRGYKNTYEFLQAIVQLDDVYHTSPMKLGTQSFPINNPVLPFLAHLYKRSLNEDSQRFIIFAYQNGNVSAIFPLLTIWSMRTESLTQYALKILKNHGKHT